MADDNRELLKFDKLARSVADFAAKFFKTFKDTIVRPNRVLTNRHDYTEPLTFLALGWLLTRAVNVLISATSSIQFGGAPTRLSEIGLSPQTPLAALVAVLPVILATIFGANLLSRIMRGNPTPDTAVAAACYPVPVYLSWLVLVYALIMNSLADIDTRPDESQQQAGLVLVVGVAVGLIWCVASIAKGILRTTAPIERRWKRWGRVTGVTVLSLFLLQGAFVASRLADVLIGLPSPLFSAGSPVRFVPWIGAFIFPMLSELWMFRLHINNETGRVVALERDSCKVVGSEIERFEVKQWSAGEAARMVIQPDERGWLDVEVIVGNRWSTFSDHEPESLTLLCQMGQKRELYNIELNDFALAGPENYERKLP